MVWYEEVSARSDKAKVRDSHAVECPRCVAVHVFLEKQLVRSAICSAGLHSK